MNKILPYILAIFFLIPMLVLGQNDCALNLKEAQQMYDDGRIEKIPGLLSSCIEDGFDREERITALRLLTLVNLYEDQYDKAENTMLELLSLDPEYKINTSIDPAEFISLYKLFKTEPAFSVGLGGGINYSLPYWSQLYGIHNVNLSTPDYSSAGTGFQVGARFTYHYKPLWDIIIEPTLINYKYDYNENIFTHSKVFSQTSGNRLAFPISVQYFFYNFSKFNFAAEAGLSYSILLSENSTFVRSYTNGELPDVTGPDINTSPLKNKHNICSLLGLQLNYKIKHAYIFLNARMQLSMNNATLNSERNAIPELEYKYFYTENDLFIHRTSCTIGYSYSFYLHKKKNQKKPVQD